MLFLISKGKIERSSSEHGATGLRTLLAYFWARPSARSANGAHVAHAWCGRFQQEREFHIGAWGQSPVEINRMSLPRVPTLHISLEPDVRFHV